MQLLDIRTEFDISIKRNDLFVCRLIISEKCSILENF